MRTFYILLILIFPVLVYSQPQLLTSVPVSTSGFTRHKGRIYFFNADTLIAVDTSGKTVIRKKVDGSLGSFIRKGDNLFLFSCGILSQVNENDGTLLHLGQFEEVWDFAQVGEQVYFKGRTAQYGLEPYKIAGNKAELVKDVRSGKESSLSNGYCFRKINNFLVFSANDSIHGAEYWSTDGTAEGTIMLSDDGEQSFMQADIQDADDDNSKLYFLGDFNLYVTDGTRDGTVLLDSTFYHQNEFYTNGNYDQITPQKLFKLNNQIVICDSYNFGTEKALWTYNLTTREKKVIDYGCSNNECQYIFHDKKDNQLFYSYYIWGAGDQFLYVTDGYSARSVSSKAAGFNIGKYLFLVDNNEYMLNAEISNFEELIQVDTVTRGSEPVKDIFPQLNESFSNPVIISSDDKYLYFLSTNKLNEKKIWKYSPVDWNYDHKLDIDSVKLTDLITLLEKNIPEDIYAEGTSDKLNIDFTAYTSEFADKVLFEINDERIIRDKPLFSAGGIADGKRQKWNAINGYYYLSARAYNTSTNAFGKKFEKDFFIYAADSITSFSLLNSVTGNEITMVESGKSQIYFASGDTFFNVRVNANVSHVPYFRIWADLPDVEPCVGCHVDVSRLSSFPYYLLSPSDQGILLKEGFYSFFASSGYLINGIQGQADLEVRKNILLNRPESLTEKLIVYPNPFQNKLFIDTDNPVEIHQVNLYDAAGLLVSEEMINPDNDKIELNLDRKNISEGIYFLTIFRIDGSKQTVLIKK